ncbi:hypothetical protein K438DRAFT_1785548 [Mycena galopus ATCC 62051]|nr:hypothetical protein K438DRAFT_1785548 [Mycena galopus ATCC 62051]
MDGQRILGCTESALPNHPDAKLVGLIIYVDKSKLSTFGMEKAYAVVARVANIAVSVRNSNNQFGGRQVVGHQPVVKEDANENNKQSFSNFKTVVWHAAFWKLLELLVHHAKLGSWTMCGDEVLLWLWPIILILASDYEEALFIPVQCALFLGTNNPICQQSICGVQQKIQKTSWNRPEHVGLSQSEKKY